MALGAVVLLTTAFDMRAAFSADDYGGGHYAEVEGLPQLDFTTYSSQIFWMFVFFILLYVFFAKKTLPEISSAVESDRLVLSS